MKVPARPRLTDLSRDAAPQWQFDSGLTHKRSVWVSSGRAAIALALAHAQLQDGDEVLMPAFFCHSMVDPVTHLGLRPRYYALNADLSPNLEHLKTILTPNCKAILVVRYFGFGQSDPNFHDLVKTAGLQFIEDRAHAFFGKTDPMADYVTYSNAKFFAVLEGGILASNRHDLSSIQTSRPGLLFQVNSALWPYRFAAEYGENDKYQRVGQVLELSRQVFPRRRANVSTAVPASANGGRGLETEWLSKSTSAFSRLRVKSSSLGTVANRRRENWSLLLSLCAGLKNIRPVLDQLPDAVAPYAAAFVTKHPEKAYRHLKDTEVPIYRWDTSRLETDNQMLQETAMYADNIFQVPVHQALSESNIRWMAEHLSIADDLAANGSNIHE